MPTRYLKPGICDSETMEKIKIPASEVFYYRLLTVVDDYGRMDARLPLLKSKCFPIKKSATEKTVSTWLADLDRAGVIALYLVQGKPFLQITKWDNKPRSAESKFPSPANADKCIQSVGNREQLHTVLPVTVTVTETVTETETVTSGKPDTMQLNGEKLKTRKAQAMEVLSFLNERAGKAYKPVESNLDIISARLKEGYTVAEMRKVIVRKCDQWKADEKMEIYLRPDTLFNKTKMANYSGELVMPK